MSSKPSYFLTTAIAYPNGVPHMGHAYEAIATDCIARFKRLDGYDVRFLTGTDEHGIKMLQTAQKAGLTPRELLDRNVPRFQAMVEAFGISVDDFIRTTEARHKASAQAIWQRMAASGDIYKSTYAGWYSVRDEAYYAEEETSVTDAGVRLGPQGTPVEWVEEESYFFRLSAYQQRLLDFYAANPDFIAPDSRRNEVVSFVSGGLQDLSISRTTFDWGIPVPGDPAHIMYVWVDALTNYITALGYPDTEGELFRTFWPADLHVIGKDIHGFLFNRGEKMSKSVGNVVDPFDLVTTYGVDAVRYFFLREVSFGQDGSYSHEAIIGRLNADLANDLGNLAQRSLSMIGKNLEGVVPAPGPLSPEDEAMLALADSMLARAREAMEVQAIHQYLAAVWGVVADANRYFAAAAPWALRKTDPARMATVLWTTAEVIRQVAILIQPVMPASAAKLLDLLAIPAEERDFSRLQGHRLAAGVTLPTPVGVFPRHVDPEAAPPA
ncbi:MAG: methionine--tRNA ligase [Rhizobiales bacterium 32-66-8]|nr:MAG: methionine--tRNA ligase [Rhizobiales bacterium 32-66-8]